MSKRSIVRALSIGLALILLALLTLQSGPPGDVPGTGSSTDPADPDARTGLTLSFVPTESNDELAVEYDPIRAHLEESLGLKVTIFTSTDYTGVIEAMRKGRVDVARFGPLSYVLAESEADAEVFAVEVRNDGQPTYRSLFVVQADSPARTLLDLEGKQVAFVDPASTSGNLIPRYMVEQATGKTPEQFFGKLIYAGSHDAAELAVKNRTVDACASNDITYDKMAKRGIIGPDTSRIIARSDPIPGIPIAYRKGLDPDLKEKIRRAVVTAHEKTRVSGQDKFIRFDPASPADYEMIRSLVERLKLGREQLLH